MKTTTTSVFSKVPTADIQRSSFDRSFGLKTTFNSDYLIPIYIDEALPADTISLALTAFGRLATPLKPIMDNMVMEFFFFSVANRLLWENWKRFNGEQDNPGDTTDYLVPQLQSGYVAAELTLGDYFGIPTGVTIQPNALHFRALNRIWNDWFRDQNLQNSVIENIGDGPDNPADYTLLKRGKRHDYFTSCLPWPQKAPSVTIPIGGIAPVIGIGKGDLSFTSGQQTVYETGGSSSTTFIKSDNFGTGAPGAFYVEEDPNNTGYPGIYADLTDQAIVTVNAMRESIQIQRLYERDARGGTRYTELLKSHFGVTSPDSRQQRSEYLGGFSVPMNITIVPNTTPDVAGTQGELAGFGTATGSKHVFNKSFTEHSVVLGFVSVRADLTYQTGLNRMWSRQTRWDYYWPALAHLGEQEVLNKEIYADGSANDDLIFGYQERFADYRYKPSLITGQFRSNATTSLDVWHLSQDFGSLPVLGSTFIEENVPIDRIIAVPSEPHFMFDSYFQIKHARPMPTYGVPGQMDHF